MKAILLLLLICAVFVYSRKLDLEAPAIDLDLINQINSNPRSTWKAGTNDFFKGKTLRDAKRLLGSKKNMKNVGRKDDSKFDIKAIPTSYDLRQAYPNSTAINNILNQGDCGSCWTFGTSESLSDRFYIASGGKVDIQLSPQTLVSCDFEGNDGCNGGIPQLAWTYTELAGLPTIECVPYTDDKGQKVKCAHECSNGQTFTRYHSKALSDKTFDSVESIQNAIYTHGSVAGTMSVYSDFMNYQSGIYVKQSNASYLGGHCIKILGWGSQGGMDYWIVANSWGRSWGINGYFWIQRGVDMCGIDHDASAAEADL
eukprot:TRINITY_DN10407_c0_g1_i1.p1 TRINITY_DN10407_c0_g1~~TRINITY_DN10407_c0_g1_i1.p1  ORF type:complete len:313 (-),score=84.94 TRINITY_DN10407_c0_g1_i1:64-1002(-)